MAKFSSKDSVVLIDGFNVLGVTTELTHSVEAVTEESTAFGDDWEAHMYVGMKRAEITQNGFYDDASASVNDALNEQQGEDRIYCIGYEGNTIGEAFTGFKGALQTNFERIASRGALHRANASYTGNGEVEEGLILHALTAQTDATGDTKSTPVQHGSQTTAGGTAYLQVSDITLGGYASVTIRVLERNGDSWGTLETFTNVTSRTAERIEIAGTVEQDLAVEWEFNGAGSGNTITFFVGFVRK